MPPTDVISCHWPARNALSPHVSEFCHCILPQRTDALRCVFPFWVLDYEYKESSLCRLEGQNDWLPRPAMTVHLYPPGAAYWEKPRPEVKITHAAWFLFTGRLKDTLGRFVRENGYATFSDPKGLVGRQLQSTAAAVQQAGQDAYWPAHAALAMCLGYIESAKHIQDHRWTLSPSGGQAEETISLVATVDEYLRTHLAVRTTLDDLADHVGVSSSTLSHQFRKLTGETPMARLLRQRVEASKVLVRRGYPLRHIAGHVGFCDEYHFAKTFKRITGMTPRQFRRGEPSTEER